MIRGSPCIFRTTNIILSKNKNKTQESEFQKRGTLKGAPSMLYSSAAYINGSKYSALEGLSLPEV
jgi:hypothetical protein